MPNLTDILAATNRKVQSPYVYLQAAGSKGPVADGGDGSTKGVHLRWEFYRSLGENHIPKGDLANSGTYFTDKGFTKQNDFVTIFRVPYTTKYPVVIDFDNNNDLPDSISTAGNTRFWTFDKTVDAISGASVETRVVISFKDTFKYDAITATINPETNPKEFIEQYDGLIEVGAFGDQGFKLSFAVTLNMKLTDPGNNISGITMMETISVPENDGGLPDGQGGTINPQLIVSCRETFTDVPDPLTPKPTRPIVSDTAFLQTDNANEHTLMAENIRFVRFKYENAFPLQIKLETYDDFIIGAARNTANAWQNLGDFALSLDDATVFNRLDNVDIDVHNNWPRFNDPDVPQANAFTVNTANYQDKWDPANLSEGLKLGVTNYLDKSTQPFPLKFITGNPDDVGDVDNLKAYAVLDYDPQPGENFTLDNQPVDNQATMLFSYQEMLKLVALDFHIARMLGLGHVDHDTAPPNPRIGNQKFIYLMAYKTEDVLETDFNPEDVMHLYMTMPTGKDEQRLPKQPALKDIAYGLFINQVNPLPPKELTKPGGYAKFDDIRYVRLFIDPAADFEFPELLPDFFLPQQNDFCLEEITDPVFYGVEYKKTANPDPGFVVPELSHDAQYSDSGGPGTNGGSPGFPEVLPIPNDADSLNPLFIHEEKEEGFHKYAAYAINWFSRVSLLSAEKQTDETIFPKINTLIPPSNLGVQLIQRENPLILTSLAEQATLAEISKEFKISVSGSTDNDGNYTVADAVLDSGNTVIEVFEKIKDATVDGSISYLRAVSIDAADSGTQKFTILNKNLTTEITAADIIKVVGSTGNDKDYEVVSVTLVLGTDTEIVVFEPVPNSIATGSISYIKTVPIGGVDTVNRKFTVTANNLTAELGPPGSEILARVTFRWNHTHNIAYTSIDPDPNDPNSTIITEADRVELFFREDITGIVRGKIKTITNLAGNKVRVKVESYVTTNGTQVNPVVPVADEGKYAGSAFNVAGISYIVDSVTNSGGLKFTLLKNVDTNLIEDPPNSNIFLSTQTFKGPDVGDFFMVTENVSDIGSWPNAKLTKEVAIENFRTPFEENGTPASPSILHTETVQNQDGTTVLQHIGGIFESAEIREFLDIDENFTNPDPFEDPLLGIVPSKSGVFKIVFDTFQLTDHPDADVDWKNGTVRIKINNANEKKTLDVIDINMSQSTLELVVSDPTFEVDSNYNPIYIPQTNVGYQPIETGTNIFVNFHPGYRVYLFEQSGLFDKNAILPAVGEGTKQTFLTVRAVDELGAEDCESYLVGPVVMIATEIVPPLPPGIPTGPTFATRPGVDGKSTYTFDTEVVVTANRQPFSMVFYRASEQSILDVLYAAPDPLANPPLPYTSETIRADLAALEAAFIADPAASPDFGYIVDHWKGLVNVILESGGTDDKKFGNYPPDSAPDPIPGTFRFPNPNNLEYRLPDADLDPNKPIVFPFPADGSILPGDTNIIPLSEGIRPEGFTMRQAVTQAINGAFLPLAENAIIYEFIKDEVQTSNRKPRVRDEQGQLLKPDINTPGYDPSPMVVKPQGITPPGITPPFVRFTDYTLDGASINIYFFYGIEIAKNSIRSERSPIFGPISLVNAFPAKSVEIKKVTTQLANPVLGIETAVVFEINPYLESERILRFEIYRATRFEDTLSLRTMKQVKIVEASDAFSVDPSFGILKDDFSDVPFPLFGDTLFYRIVAIREIINEQNNLENIPSFPSNTVQSSIVDVINPVAPEITFNSDALTTISPVQLPNGVLRWDKAAHNGKYFVFKMNNTGNFELLDTIITNDSKIFFIAGDLIKEDEDGNEIYHRYKVDVENSSGLLNLDDNIITI